MTDYRWSKFWWQDYEADAALKLVSLAAQGLWMRMLCVMHRGEPYGYLTVAGRRMTIDQLAKVVGAERKEVAKLVDELQSARVFSLDIAGLLFSRRLVRDKELSDDMRARGKQGGNPQITRKVKQDRAGQVKQEVNQESPGQVKPEAESESEERKKAAPLTPQVGRKPDPFHTGMADLETVDGHPTCNGYHVDIVFEACCDAARIRSETATLATWQPVIEWLSDGYGSGDILRVIKTIADRADYKPPRTLGYFTKAIREEATPKQPAIRR